jgi:hypothetical protein
MHQGAQQTMSANVLPFPFSRQRYYIARQINNVADYNPEAAQRYLDKRIAEREASLRRAGVAENLIAPDVEPVRAMFDAGLNRLFGRQRKA